MTADSIHFRGACLPKLISGGSPSLSDVRALLNSMYYPLGGNFWLALAEDVQFGTPPSVMERRERRD